MANNSQISFEPTHQHDVDALVAIRIEAMRDSLERIGRFDRARARERFSAVFAAELTRYIVANSERVGFFVMRPQPEWLLLDHLYITPAWQKQGIGARVLQHVIVEADKLKLPIRVGVLRGSDSNRFYLRYGFGLVDSTEFDNHYLRPATEG